MKENTTQKENNAENSKSDLETWIKDNPEEALEIVQQMTGHDLFDPEILDSMPDNLQESFVKVHESGDHHKSTIYVDGKPVDELEAVDGKDVLRRFKTALGVTTKSFMGRGFQARADKEALEEEINEVSA